MNKNFLRKIMLISILALMTIFAMTLASIIRGESNKIEYKNLEMLKNNYNTCTFEKPQLRTIILRMDDIGSNRYELARPIVGVILLHGYPVSLGVIPTRLDEKTVSWLKTLNDAEFALHGYEHSEFEFRDIDEEITKQKLESGRKEIYDKLSVIPVTFIPPNNQYTQNTISALHEEGFKVLAANENEMNFKDLAIMGYTTHTKPTEGRLPNEKIIERCSDKLDKNGLCIIMMHPQDFMDPETKQLSPQRYAEFNNLLDSLGELNAEFKTFKDLVKC